MPTVLEPIQVVAGVEPSTDRTETTTQHYTSSKHIRFVDGYPEKIGGWDSFDFNDSNEISGIARSLFSYILDGYNRYIVGTHTRLYDIFGSELTNITPLKTTSIDIANSIATYYDTLGNDPISTTDGSTTITIADTAHKLQAGDTIEISGSTAVNGIPAVEINSSQLDRDWET